MHQLAGRSIPSLDVPPVVVEDPRQEELAIGDKRHLGHLGDQRAAAHARERAGFLSRRRVAKIDFFTDRRDGQQPAVRGKRQGTYIARRRIALPLDFLAHAQIPNAELRIACGSRQVAARRDGIPTSQRPAKSVQLLAACRFPDAQRLTGTHRNQRFRVRRKTHDLDRPRQTGRPLAPFACRQIPRVHDPPALGPPHERPAIG